MMIAALHSIIDKFTSYFTKDGVFAQTLFEMR